MKAPKKAKRPTVEVVDSRYQPSKAELEEEFSLPDFTPEDVARALTHPVDVRYVSRPARPNKKRP